MAGSVVLVTCADGLVATPEGDHVVTFLRCDWNANTALYEWGAHGTCAPSLAPTKFPTPVPTKVPTKVPTEAPTKAPTPNTYCLSDFKCGSYVGDELKCRKDKNELGTNGNYDTVVLNLEACAYGWFSAPSKKQRSGFHLASGLKFKLKGAGMGKTVIIGNPSWVPGSGNSKLLSDKCAINANRNGDGELEYNIPPRGGGGPHGKGRTSSCKPTEVQGMFWSMYDENMKNDICETTLEDLTFRDFCGSHWNRDILYWNEAIMNVDDVKLEMTNVGFDDNQGALLHFSSKRTAKFFGNKDNYYFKGVKTPVKSPQSLYVGGTYIREHPWSHYRAMWPGMSSDYPIRGDSHVKIDKCKFKGNSMLQREKNVDPGRSYGIFATQYQSPFSLTNSIFENNEFCPGSEYKSIVSYDECTDEKRHNRGCQYTKTALINMAATAQTKQRCAIAKAPVATTTQNVLHRLWEPSISGHLSGRATPIGLLAMKSRATHSSISSAEWAHRKLARKAPGLVNGRHCILRPWGGGTGKQPTTTMTTITGVSGTGGLREQRGGGVHRKTAGGRPALKKIVEQHTPRLGWPWLALAPGCWLVRPWPHLSPRLCALLAAGWTGRPGRWPLAALRW
jgi:hypothetical protein